MIVSYSLQPKGAEQNAVGGAGDTHPAIRLVVGDGASGHGTNTSVNRTIVVTASCQRPLNGGFLGIVDQILLVVIPDSSLFVLMRGIRREHASRMTVDVIAKIHKKSRHDPQRVKYPAAAIMILVLIVIVIGLHNERNAQEADYRERK